MDCIQKRKERIAMCPRLSLAWGLLLPLFVSANGCAVSGQPFQRASAGPGKSIVYAYRPYAFTGAAIGLPVEVVETKDRAVLGPGGYQVFQVNPGPITVVSKTEGTSVVQLDASAGQSHYVKVSIGWGVWQGRGILQQVDGSAAEKEIVDCKLQP
jgi:hypothetical protein